MAYIKTEWVNGETPLNETNLNNIENGIETNDKAINGTVLFENVEGVVGDLTIQDDITNYAYVDIAYSRSSWDSPTITNRYFVNKEANKCCAMLSVVYGTASSKIIVVTAYATITETTLAFETVRSMVTEIATSASQSNTNAIKIFKIVGYKSGD